MNGEVAIGLSHLDALVKRWRDRCENLAREGKYWEAGRLSEAANELAATMNNPLHRQGQSSGPIVTDTGVRDSYDRARQFPSLQTPNVLYPQTRVVD